VTTEREPAEWGWAIPGLRAVRTKKARRDGGRCALCPCELRLGQRIGLAAGQWGHVSCIVRAASERRSREAQR
jgi:hypothetical protein